MRYFVLACDYDDTLARHGRVDEATLQALSRLVDSARKLVMVTGRALDDLLANFPEARLFSRIVAENGAVLYNPESRARTRLGEPPPPDFVAHLRQRGVEPLDVGDVIVATREPHESTVLATIRDMGMGHQVIFNKGAVMVLPPGVDKGTGLAVALDELGFSRHNVVGVGDAENDHAFLQTCELAASVGNALPLVKDRADLVTRGEASRGVVELIDQLVETDLADVESKLSRHHLMLGDTSDHQPIAIPSYGATVLVAGPSGSGKSQITTAIFERVVAHGYQACLVDPEGDYEELEGAVSVGSAESPPNVDELLRMLGKPATQAAVNLLGVPLHDRPAYFADLLPRLQSLRSHTGRPHWIMIDEAHHLLPAEFAAAPLALPQSFGSLLLVTVHPDKVSAAVLESVRIVLAVGPGAQETFANFARAVKLTPPVFHGPELAEGEVAMWRCRSEQAPFRVVVAPAASVHKRHRRKYAQGELPPERSFYFHGPDGALNLRAQNLAIFLQLSSGVDERTWLFHLRKGDYSRWFRDHIKDDELARRAQEIERDRRAPAAESRAAIRAAVEEHYTLPA